MTEEKKDKVDFNNLKPLSIKNQKVNLRLLQTPV